MNNPTIINCDSFGTWLRKEKESRGLTTAQVAEIAGVSKCSIDWYLTGRQRPTLDTVELIARAFGKVVAIYDMKEVCT